MFDLHNPCGIQRERHVEWRGQCFDQHDPELVAFVGPFWSVRACAHQLMALGRHGRRATPTAIALRFALGDLARLCVAASAASDHGIDVTDPDTLGRLIRVIAAEKTGAEIDDATLAEGLRLATIPIALAA